VEIGFGGRGNPVAIPIPYNAADFSASAAMTWTVDAIDVVTFSYLLEGKKLTLWWRLTNTTVGGVVAGANLLIRFPNGLRAAMETVQVTAAAPGGAAFEAVLAFTQVGLTTFTVLRFSAAWVLGVNNTDVSGILTVMVQ
jgi:hypothetical protein